MEEKNEIELVEEKTEISTAQTNAEAPATAEEKAEMSAEEAARLEEAARELDKIETIPAHQNTEEKNEEYTEDKAKKPKRKRKFHWWIILIAVLLAALIAIVAIWFITPSKKLNVALLNKTVLTLDDEDATYNEEALYRKHQGFFWLLNQQKYVKEDNKEYNFKEDYYGTILDGEGKYDHIRNLSDMAEQPDLVYIADLYGAIDDDYGYYNGSIGGETSGLTPEDMMMVYSAHESGATVIAEMETFHTSLSDSVANQLQYLCGVSSTSWVGRYIVDLADLTDVPDWAPPMYFEQEGVEWQFSGPGILLVGEGQIIVLEQKVDFESKDLLRIYVNEDYKKEFKGVDTCDFYNWFELVTANAGTEVIATFEFDVNATGMEKLKEFNTEPRFAAITRKNYGENGAPVYYFAGDFNDYVSYQRMHQFMFADSFYRLTTYERQGDITNFYWNFYNPFVKKILRDTYVEAKENDEESKEEQITEVAKLQNSAFALYGDGTYHPLALDSVSINAVKPGSRGAYSNDHDFYANLIEEATLLGANTLYVKDLLPAEFYSAVYENNKNADKKLNIIQTITTPDGIGAKGCTSKAALASWKSKIESVVNALHGDATVEESENSSKSSYKISVSNSVISFVIDADITADFIKDFDGKNYSFDGTYAAAKGIEGYLAYLFDTVETAYAAVHGDYSIPVGVMLSADALSGTNFAVKNAVALTGVTKDAAFEENYLYTVTSVGLTSSLLDGVKGSESDTSFDKYANVISQISTATDNRFLITGITSSANIATFSEKFGLSEKEQGNQIVSMLTAVNSFGSVGGVVCDLNDSWTNVSDDYSPLMSPSESIGLWRNVTDPAQMTGLVSVEQPTPTQNEMILADDDRMQHMYFSSNAEYLYITLELLTEIEYNKETLFVGIDTYQRNDGEYYFANDFVATSLSGMEYVLRFDGRQNVSLWVTKDYNRSKGGYVTKESYVGAYDKVADLVYGGFGSTQNQFYETGATIYIRIPWMWLNITDPSQKMVLNNLGSDLGEKANSIATNGILFSVMIGDIETKDVLYQFPEQKQDPGYKTYKWAEWADVKDYTFNERDSFDVVKNYFSGR